MDDEAHGFLCLVGDGSLLQAEEKNAIEELQANGDVARIGVVFFLPQFGYGRETFIVKRGVFRLLDINEQGVVKLLEFGNSDVGYLQMSLVLDTFGKHHVNDFGIPETQFGLMLWRDGCYHGGIDLFDVEIKGAQKVFRLP